MCEETIYCLYRHLKSFHDQAKQNRIADFGEPCKDCKQFIECGGNWLDKVGDRFPKDIGITLVQEHDKKAHKRHIHLDK